MEIKKVARIGLSCFFAYAGCYVGKNVLSAMMPQMTASGSVLSPALGYMGTAFLFAYAIGQLINGFLGDCVSAKYMVSVGLWVTGIITLLIPVIEAGWLAIVLWGVCGLCCSMLYGPISSVIGNNMLPKVAAYLISALSAAAALGTILTNLIAILTVSDWTVAYLVCGIILLVCGSVWFVLYAYMEKKDGIVSIQTHESLKASVGVLKQALSPAFFLVSVTTMTSGVIRNALSLWIPTMLENYLSFSNVAAQSASAVNQIILIVASMVTLVFLKFTKNNEITAMTIYSALTAVFFGLMILFAETSPFVSMLCMFLALSANVGTFTMTFSVYILRFKSIGKISGLSGYFDFVSYIGAAAVNIFFTGLAGQGNWTVVLLLLVGMAVLGAVATAFAIPAGKEESPI